MAGDIPLRDYIEQRWEQHRRQHDDEREASERALDLWRRTLDARLELLNELRVGVVTKAEHVAHVQAFERERDSIQEQLGELRSAVDQRRGREAAFAVVLSVMLVVISVGVTVLLQVLS